MSLVNLCRWSIYVVGQFISLVNLYRWSIYIVGQFISLSLYDYFFFQTRIMNVKKSKEIFEGVKSIQKVIEERERKNTQKLK
jgi:hypothetical protein